MTSFLRRLTSVGNFFYIFCAIFLVCAVFSTVAFGISRGYQTQDSSLKPGMVVSLSPENREELPVVERATEEDLQSIIGVATTVEDSSITVASSGETVFVESEGEVSAYVSDLNGQVKQGDQLTLSPLNGILAIADNNSKIIIGTVLDDFPVDGMQTRTINTAEGTTQTNVALIRINLNTKLVSAQSSSSLEKLGRSIAGKDISEIRVVVALVVFLLVLFAEGGILYGSTSSAITSLGRNPLAGQIIRRQLIQVMFAAFGVLAVGLTSVYLILLA
jgi:hypothetical protein